MDNGFNNVREFGRFRLDVDRQVLWCDNSPVRLPLKCIEVLAALTERGNQVVTKTELLDRIWQDSFVEESNLSRHVYLLRKTFEEFGEANLIETIPRRGYRFTGEVREVIDKPDEISIEEYSVTTTMIEVARDEPSAIDTARSAVALLPAHQASTFWNHRRWFAAAVVLVTIAGAAAWRYQTWAGSSTVQIRSIAVLPFKTIDSSSENQHQGIGLADLLITRLSNVSELIVRPTSAVTRFTDEDSITAGKTLGVDAVLEGTIYRVGEKVRVTTRLVRISDGSPVWSGEVEKSLADELKMQDEIALQVIGALSVSLSGNERAALTKRFTDSSEAYDLYLRGRYEWNKRSTSAMDAAELLFHKAIEKDPNFALAYVGLADRLATKVEARKVYGLAEKALELDPNLAEAHATIGFLKMFHEWNWDEAEKAFKRSIELKPNYATAHHWYATLLAIQGRYPEGKEEMRRAIEIDPLSHNFLADLGQIYYFERDYEKAEEYCRRALEIYPEFTFAHLYLHHIYLMAGEYEQSIESAVRVMEIETPPGSKEGMEILEQMKKTHRRWYRDGGIRGYHAELLKDWNERLRPSFFSMARTYSFLGNKEAALLNLERALEYPEAFFFVYVRADPVFDPIRDEPRYKAILRKMRLPE